MGCNISPIPALLLIVGVQVSVLCPDTIPLAVLVLFDGRLVDYITTASPLRVVAFATFALGARVEVSVRCPDSFELAVPTVIGLLELSTRIVGGKGRCEGEGKDDGNDGKCHR